MSFSDEETDFEVVERNGLSTDTIDKLKEIGVFFAVDAAVMVAIYKLWKPPVEIMTIFGTILFIAFAGAMLSVRAIE